MAGYAKLQGELIKAALAKFPDTSTHALATKIYNENPLVFSTFEAARSRVRYYRGANGKTSRKNISTDKFIRTEIPKLPESSAEVREAYVMPKGNNSILLLSDFHAPYHDNAAITAALNYGVEAKVNTIIINGDMLDFHQLSRFQKDPRARSVKEEFDTARAILVFIRHKFPTQRIIWLKGNHDKRYEHWLFNKAPEVFNDSYYHLEERLRLNELKIELFDDMVMIKAGKLHITHGHLMIKGVFAPVNAARGLYLRAKQSCIIGHTHSVSQHTEKNLSGELTSCWSTGCLCELRPAYDPYTNKHGHGFAHIKVEKDGNFTVKNFMIFKGKIL